MAAQPPEPAPPLLSPAGGLCGIDTFEMYWKTYGYNVLIIDTFEMYWKMYGYIVLIHLGNVLIQCIDTFQKRIDTFVLDDVNTMY